MPFRMKQQLQRELVPLEFLKWMRVRFLHATLGCTWTPSRISLAFPASCPAATMHARVTQAPRTGSRWETSPTPTWAGLPRPDISNARGSCSISEWSCRWSYQSLMYIWRFHWYLFSGKWHGNHDLLMFACFAFVRVCAIGLCHYLMRLLPNQTYRIISAYKYEQALGHQHFWIHDIVQPHLLVFHVKQPFFLLEQLGCKSMSMLWLQHTKLMRDLYSANTFLTSSKTYDSKACPLIWFIHWLSPKILAHPFLRAARFPYPSRLTRNCECEMRVLISWLTSPTGDHSIVG